MDEQLRKQFATNLRRYLTNAGKTQTDLAKYIGVSTATASDWCNGNKMPRTDKIQSICNWLGIGLENLLGNEEPDEYYLDPETRKAAQEIFEDSNMRILFDAARGSSPENLRLAAEMLKRFKGEA